MNDSEKISELLEAFCKAAKSKGNFVASSELDHELHSNMGVALKGLREFGIKGTAALKALLNHDSEYVRIWVASELLSEGDLDAKPVLEEIAESKDLIGFIAGVVLDEFKAGNLKSPFGAK